MSGSTILRVVIVAVLVAALVAVLRHRADTAERDREISEALTTAVYVEDLKPEIAARLRTVAPGEALYQAIETKFRKMEPGEALYHYTNASTIASIIAGDDEGRKRITWWQVTRGRPGRGAAGQ